MMNQEEYVDVHGLKIEGWTAVEIAAVTGTSAKIVAPDTKVCEVRGTA